MVAMVWPMSVITRRQLEDKLQELHFEVQGGHSNSQ